MFDTIVAISSGVVNQPISIIRLSGPDAFDIVRKFFSGKVGVDKTFSFGVIKNNDEIIDEVLVASFVGPNTFTGENIVEINAHGGIVNSNRILKLALLSGARQAEPGEFSHRAFLNGKIDLVKAEAIHDLVFAKTETQAKLAVKKFDSETSALIDDLKKTILEIVATIEINIDYPEYDDVEQLTNEKLLPALKDVKKSLEDIVVSSKKSQYIHNGVNVAIVGKANAGKSSLLNALLNEDKAIVSSQPGTTRDIVEGQLQINQLLLNFSDTAGIRSTENEIEQMGIKKTLKQIDNADLVIHLVDATATKDKDDLAIEELAKIKKYIKVYNKSDIKRIPNEINISAQNKDLKELYTALNSAFEKININDAKIVNNTRQLSLIEKSLQNIQTAITSLENNITPDVVIVDIRKAWEDLANILGRAEQSDLLDLMFKNFCLGK